MRNKLVTTLYLDNNYSVKLLLKAEPKGQKTKLFVIINFVTSLQEPALLVVCIISKEFVFTKYI